MRYFSLVAPALAGLCSIATAQLPAPTSPGLDRISVSGTLPDEASKAAVLARLRELYGADQIVDQIGVGSVSMPANWSGHIQKLINPHLKWIKHGQLKIDGNNVSVRGEVANETQRQQIASDIASYLNPSYTVTNGLRVNVAKQGMLDTTLAGRIIEFDIGKASITASGQGILDEMATVLQKLKSNRVELTGHTDNVGLRESNLILSQARAEAVRTYLTQKGISPDRVTASGQGPDQPLANNNSPEGRARNRRIEFKIAK